MVTIVLPYKRKQTFIILTVITINTPRPGIEDGWQHAMLSKCYLSV